MPDPISSKFDSAAADALKARFHGHMQTPEAQTAMMNAIKADGKVEDSEIALFQDTAENALGGSYDEADFDPVTHVKFGVDEKRIDDNVGRLHEEQPLPGSEISGQPPHFANTDQMLNGLSQVDELATETTNDNDRCGAAAWIGNLVLQGPNELQHGITELSHNPAVPRALRNQLAHLDVTHGPVKARDLHIAMEAAYKWLNHLDPGEAGISTAAIWDQAKRSYGTPSGGLVDSMPALEKGQRAMVLVQPAVPAKSDHWMVVGRDQKGYYAYDPGNLKGFNFHRYNSEADMRQAVDARKVKLDTFQGHHGEKGLFAVPMTQHSLPVH